MFVLLFIDNLENYLCNLHLLWIDHKPCILIDMLWTCDALNTTLQVLLLWMQCLLQVCPLQLWYGWWGNRRVCIPASGWLLSLAARCSACQRVWAPPQGKWPWRWLKSPHWPWHNELMGSHVQGVICEVNERSRTAAIFVWNWHLSKILPST